MKKSLFLFLALPFLFSSCGKDNDCDTPVPTNQASATETAFLQSYLTANGITAASTHGMFYSFATTGNGESPNLCNTVSVVYSGVLISGTSDGPEFDSSSGGAVSLQLERLIPGWQLVLPMVKTGSTVIMYIPPSLGYGSQAAGPIPANSYLKFTVTLGGIQ